MSCTPAQFRIRPFRAFLAVIAVVALGASSVSAAPPRTAATGLLPDLRTVVPRHLQMVNAGQEEILRFSNSIANTGAGPLAVRPEPPPREAELSTTAVQELRDSNAIYRCGSQPKNVVDCFNVVSEVVAGTIRLPPEHNHWHIGQAALFSVRRGSPTGPVVGAAEVESSFCLLDIINLDGNAPTSGRGFWDCYTSYQGISSGWADQYHQATVGQQLVITDLPNAEDYYLVSVSNPDQILVESDYSNNEAWVRFSVAAGSKGNRKITVFEHSTCSSPGLCGEYTANRG